MALQATAAAAAVGRSIRRHVLGIAHKCRTARHKQRAHEKQMSHSGRSVSLGRVQEGRAPDPSKAGAHAVRRAHHIPSGSRRVCSRLPHRLSNGRATRV
jgi:hypothetical protein